MLPRDLTLQPRTDGLGPLHRFAPCAVYALQLPQSPQLTDAAVKHDQYAQHYWLQRALQRHPWRVHEICGADAVYVNASFTFRHGSRYPAADSLHRWIAHFWANTSKACATPRIPMFYVSAMAPAYYPQVPQFKWGDLEGHVRILTHVGTGARNAKTRFASAGGKHFSRYDMVVPHVLSQPSWLLGSGQYPAELVPWEQRKLIFFAGKIPHMYLRSTRFKLWRALANRSGVSVYADMAPNIKRYRELECYSKDKAQRGLCKAFSRVNFGAVAASWTPSAAAARLSGDEYYKAAMSHRFCIVAAGDDPSTKKSGEFVAVSAKGGCVPLVVVDGVQWQALPFLDSTDYCRAALFVPLSAFLTQTDALLARLRNVSAAEARARMEFAKQIAHLWEMREDSTLHDPSAAEETIADICEDARTSLEGSSKAEWGADPTRKDTGVKEECY